MTSGIKLALVLGAVAVVGAALYFVWGPGPGPDSPLAELPDPEATLQDPELLAAYAPADRAAGCVAAAMRIANGDAHTRSDDTIMEERWVHYLGDLQASGQHQNWSADPCSLYLQNHRTLASDALISGIATFRVVGLDLTRVTVSVTLTGISGPGGGNAVVVPVGTRFASASADTQNMIAARSQLFVFGPVASNSDDARTAVNIPEPDRMAATARRVSLLPNPATRSITLDVPAYCVNRWRNTPGAESQFAVDLGHERDEVGLLARCLEGIGEADQRDKQVAVWLVSDGILDMTPVALRQRLREEGEAHDAWRPEVVLEQLHQENPQADREQLIELIRTMPDDEVERRLSAITPEMRDQYIERSAVEGVKEFVDYGGPLLEACGYDLSNRTLFSSGDAGN